MKNIIIILFFIVALASCNSLQMKRATKASSQMAHLVMEIQESDTITKRQIALYKRLLKKESSMIIYLKDDSSTIRLRKLFQDKQLPFKIN